MSNVNLTESCLEFSVGRCFESYDRLKETLESLCQRTHQLFSIHSSLKFQRSDNRLVYTKIHYRCKNGIKSRQTGKGLRPNQSYFGLGCKSEIVVVYNKVLDNLSIKKACFEHNHEVSQSVFSFYPEQRRLTVEAEKFVCNASALRANQKLVAEQVRTIFGKHATSRDISNCIAKKRKDVTLSQVEKVVAFLDNARLKDPDAYLQIITDDATNLVDVIFYQSGEMRNWYCQFPELVELDGTYRLNDSGYVLYLFTVLDGNGISRVVAWCFLSMETQENVRLCFEAFLNSNSSVVGKTTVVLLDKDFESVDCTHKTFSNAEVLLCQVHVERNFNLLLKGLHLNRMELSALGMADVTIESLKTRILKCLKILLFTHDSSLFDNVWCNLLSDDLVPADFKSRFTKNWYSCRKMWAYCFRKNLKTFKVNDTNRIEAQNKHIKDVVRKYSCMFECVKGLFTFCSLHKFNVDHREYLSKCKTIIVEEGADALVDLVKKIFSEFASRHILQQYHVFREKQSLFSVCVDGNGARVTFGSVDHYVTGDCFSICCCEFFSQMNLPCKHMFAARDYLKLTLIDVDVVSDRFKRQNVSTTIFPSILKPAKENIIVTSVKKVNTKPPLTVSEKYSTMYTVCKRICDLASKLGNEDFNLKLAFMQQIYLSWNEEGFPSKTQKPSEAVVVNDECGIQNFMESEQTSKEHALFEKKQVSPSAVQTKPDLSNIFFRRQRKIVGNVKGLTASQRSFRRKKNLSHLKLTEVEENSLRVGSSIIETVIVKAAQLIKLGHGRSHPQDPRMAFKRTLFTSSREPVVQIIPFENTYVTVKTSGANTISLYCGKKLDVADSDKPGNRFMSLYSRAASLLTFPESPASCIEFIAWPTTESNCPREQALIAVACAVDLCRGADPSSKVYNLGQKFSEYAIQCFRNLHFMIFPSSKNFERISQHSSVRVALYCVCKQPDTGLLKMINCHMCDDWYHPECTDVPPTYDPVWVDLNYPWVCKFCSDEPAAQKLNNPVPCCPTLDLQLFPQGGIFTADGNTVVMQNTCSIDACITPFHVLNIDSSMALQRYFLSHAHKSVEKMGEVLSLSIFGRFSEAKMCWLNHIGKKPAGNVIDVWGDLDNNFTLFFQDLVLTKVCSICTNSECKFFESENIEKGIAFNRLVTNSFQGTLENAVQQWAEPYSSDCRYFFPELSTCGDTIVDLTGSCPGIRSYSHREIISEIPPFLILQTGDLCSLEDFLPEHLEFFGTKFDFVGTVHHRTNHFLSSVVFKGSRLYYDNQSKTLFKTPWKERASIAFYLKSDILH
ncbi:uncharacterized protein LOC142501947 [Ascaphus truei]|uniref:uncharacterized protein LOC142501947 n=1 Tax=Ascaphus truei TaxID=8439 RepID=UPI003F59605B